MNEIQLYKIKANIVDMSLNNAAALVVNEKFIHRYTLTKEDFSMINPVINKEEKNEILGKRLNVENGSAVPYKRVMHQNGYKLLSHKCKVNVRIYLHKIISSKYGINMEFLNTVLKFKIWAYSNTEICMKNQMVPNI